MDLFKQAWTSIRNGTAPRYPQSSGGTFHRMRDVAEIDEIDLNRTYVARDLINILRARTFPRIRAPTLKAAILRSSFEFIFRMRTHQIPTNR